MSTIIGISVGTGDPDLITLKAYKALQSVDVIVYVSNKGHSFARSIVSPHMKTDVIEIDIDMPMKTDTSHATAAYDIGATKISDCIAQGKSVGILCEGDALFYGSFMYLYARLKNVCDISIIPGITSISAGASATATALTSRNDILTVVPATNDITIISKHLDTADTIIFMKIGRHFDKVKTAIDTAGLLSNSTCIIKASCEDEEIHPLSDIAAAPYFSIIIVRKNNILY